MATKTYLVVEPTDVALAPPPGVIPEFGDPFSLRPYQNVSMSLGLICSGIFLAARLYTKARVFRRFEWEDCKPDPSSRPCNGVLMEDQMRVLSDS